LEKEKLKSIKAKVESKKKTEVRSLQDTGFWILDAGKKQ